jgi:hypothetical protein
MLSPCAIVIPGHATERHIRAPQAAGPDPLGFVRKPSLPLAAAPQAGRSSKVIIL